MADPVLTHQPSAFWKQSPHQLGVRGKVRCCSLGTCRRGVDAGTRLFPILDTLSPAYGKSQVSASCRHIAFSPTDLDHTGLAYRNNPISLAQSISVPSQTNFPELARGESSGRALAILPRDLLRQNFVACASTIEATVSLPTWLPQPRRIPSTPG